MPRPARPRPTNLSHPHSQPPFPASVSLYTCGEVETGNSQPSASSRSINYHSNRSINYRGHSYLAPLWSAEWVVYTKAPFDGPQQVLRYVARYTHRVPISNDRLLDIEDGRVSVSWKDYRDNNHGSEIVVSFFGRLLLSAANSMCSGSDICPGSSLCRSPHRTSCRCWSSSGTFSAWCSGGGCPNVRWIV